MKVGKSTAGVQTASARYRFPADKAWRPQLSLRAEPDRLGDVSYQTDRPLLAQGW